MHVCQREDGKDEVSSRYTQVVQHSSSDARELIRMQYSTEQEGS